MQNNRLEILKNKKIAVLCGGVSAEAEVSLDSGNAVFSALQSRQLDVEMVIIDGTAEQISKLECDLAFIALHGEFGEDGTVQQLLAEQGIPFTGSAAQASRICMDKNLTKEKFVENSIPVAPWICLTDSADAVGKMRRGGLDFPVVVKPNSGGSSVGVYIVRTDDDLTEAVESVLRVDRYVIVERYVDGIELTCSVLEGKALPLIELKAAEEFYDYHAKYKADTTVYECPPKNVSSRVLEECAEYSERIFRNLQLRDMARVDYICSRCGDIIALEINTIPGFTSHSLLPKAAGKTGLEFADLCVEIAAMACLRAAEQGCC